MNIVNRFFLWLLLLPQQLYWRMGVNTNHLRAILATKLLMDDRRVPPMQQVQRKKKQRLPRFATIGTMFFSAIVGMLFLFAFSVGADYITQLGLYFSFYIFLLAAMLITDFTTVLIDVRDNLIILPKPVNDRTFLLARLLHIVTHVSKLVLPMSIPGMVYLGINEGAMGLLAFLLLVICATLFTVFLINAVYVVILQLTTPEKFKNIISYFQIIFAIVVYGAYQLLPRMFSAAFFNGYSLSHSRVAWLLPPYWFAAAWQYLNGGVFGSRLVFTCC
jgi:ABC-2 type transport system permease protein